MHVDHKIWDWFHGHLTAEESKAFDDHVGDCPMCQAALTAEVEQIASMGDLVTVPEPAGRDELLAAATPWQRLSRFVTRVAELAYVSKDTAQAWLRDLAEPEVWEETEFGDVELFHISGGPELDDAIVGFVRVSAGTSFPEHTHVGDEIALVVQGTMRDGDEIYRTGELVERPGGTTHEVHAEPGPDLVYLTIVMTGVEIGGHFIGPGDPEL